MILRNSKFDVLIKVYYCISSFRNLIFELLLTNMNGVTLLLHCYMFEHCTSIDGTISRDSENTPTPIKTHTYVNPDKKHV